MDSPGVYDQSVLDGLDYLIAQMGKRGMKAVLVLNNFWQWSGGMGQYVSWQEKTPIPTRAITTRSWLTCKVLRLHRMPDLVSGSHPAMIDHTIPTPG